jgi:hypothetical protein
VFDKKHNALSEGAKRFLAICQAKNPHAVRCPAALSGRGSHRGGAGRIPRA